MTEAVLAFQEIRRKLSSATLVEMNKTLIYDDVGIALMTHALELCAKHFEMDAQKINASSSVNFITTRLDKTELAHMLDWNGTGGGFVQKPDAVFQMFYPGEGGTRKEMLIYYESDAGDKANNKDRKQAARKMFQSTCGCREVNADLPAISVRANVFSGPRVDLHLEAADKYSRSEVQRRAQNALDFLHQLLVAHVWVCCQVCLLAKGTGNLVALATRPVSKEQFDLHFLVGHINSATVFAPRVRLFDAPGVEVNIDTTEYKVAGAARVQVLCVQRCVKEKISAKVLLAVSTVAANAGVQHLNGMLTVQDLWHLLRCCAQHAPSRHVNNRQLVQPPELIEWKISGAKVIGLPGDGIATKKARSAVDFKVCEYKNPGKAKASTQWNLAMGLVAEYYDASCKGLYDAIFHDMTWLPLGKDNKTYLKDLKKLKAESRRDGSVLQSRTQAASLQSLGMTDGLGFASDNISTNNLNSLCMRSLLGTLPKIDPRLEKYINSFNAPNVTLFLRLIRCTNVLAFEHLAKTHDSSKWSDNFQHSVNFFPVGTAADIDFIMQYTLSNSKAIHSTYLAPSTGLSPAQSENVEHPASYVWVHALLQEIIADSRNTLHSKLNNSPLQSKLLLCHRKVYDLLHSVTLRAPHSNAATLPVPSETDTRSMHKKIISCLISNKIMYYIDSVDEHTDFLYNERLQDKRGDMSMKENLQEIRAKVEHAARVPQLPQVPQLLSGPRVLSVVTRESDNEHAARIAATPIKYTRLTWPLRDLNVYTRISEPLDITDQQGTRRTYPYYLSYVDNLDWMDDERETFKFLQEMQDHTDNYRVLRDNAFEEDIVLKVPPMIIPRKIADNFSQVRALFTRMQKECIAVDAAPAVPVVAAPAVPVVAAVADKKKATKDTTDNILQAYRWKAMLIKTTLLSALNGICFELKKAISTTFSIRHYAVTGPEYRRADPERLVLQNFVFLPQNSEPPWFTNGAKAILWTHYRRSNMTHLFRLRRLVPQPANANLQLPDVDHDLTKFVFGLFVAGNRMKHLWKIPIVGSDKYIATGRKANRITAAEKDYSSRIDSSEAEIEYTLTTPHAKSRKLETNYQWYRYLCEL